MTDAIPFPAPKRTAIAPQQCRAYHVRLQCPLCHRFFMLRVYVGLEQDFNCMHCGRELAGYQPAGEADADREASDDGGGGAA